MRARRMGAGYFHRYFKGQFLLLWAQCMRVMRLGSPIGWILLAIPGFWGYVWGCPDGSNSTVLWIVLGAIWARSLGCFYNDWVDRDLDSVVRRTCNRPLVAHPPSRGMLWIMAGIFTLGACCFIYYLPISCTILGIMGGVGTLVYPWAKRFTAYPQVILALIFNLAVWMPVCIENRPCIWGLALLYGYGMLWTIAYDTVYAFQDVQDDVPAGIGSLAVKLGYKRGWWVLGALIVVRFGMLAVLARYAGSLGWSAAYSGMSAGICDGSSVAFSASAPGASLFHYAFLFVLMAYQLGQWFRWELESPTQCGVYFRNAPHEGYWTTLWLITLVG